MYGGRSNYKDNFGRWQKTVTVNLTKKLMKEAEALQINVEQVVADKLKEVHKQNVVASYYPRARGEQEKVAYNKAKKAEESEKNRGKYGEDRKRLSRKTLSYEHTGILEGAIDAKIEKKSKYESRVSIIVKPDPYPNDGHREETITAAQVYEWLREGTNGGGTYWFVGKNGKQPTTYNYPTPAHLFEMHTSLQMKGWLDTLDVKHYIRKKKYRKG
jgi:hypothetical protein